jgi:hypothetical protein
VLSVLLYVTEMAVSARGVTLDFGLKMGFESLETFENLQKLARFLQKTECICMKNYEKKGAKRQRAKGTKWEAAVGCLAHNCF